jgi:hypothetical protein
MIVVTGTAAVILICLGVAVYVLEFAGKTARYKDRRSGAAVTATSNWVQPKSIPQA